MVSTISILYVDDEQEFLEISKLCLEREKEFSVTTASSGSVALNLLKSNGIQAIVSDYQMPGMEGIEFLKQVRAINKRIPVIIFTGRGREEIAIEALENGADFYLQKGGEPVPQFAELVHKIHESVDHPRAEALNITINQLNTVISATNKAIVHIHDKKELLSEICRIVVDTGGLKMAWAGCVNEKKHLIEPVASHGHIDGYLDSIAISTDPVLEGKNPTGTAFREKTHNFCNDIATDPKMAPWRDGALQRGYRSLAAFPFAPDTKNAGVLTFYASEPGFFNDQIIQILKEQSGDITFALTTLDHEEQRIVAENELKSSELRYRRLFETAQDAILILDADSGEIIDANRFILDLLGYPLEYFVGKHLWELGFFEDKSLAQSAFSELQTNGYIRYEDLPLETKDGRSIKVEFVSNMYLVGDKRIIQCNIRDITERKMAQALLKATETCYRRLFETAQDGILIIDVETGKIVDANPYILDLLGYPLEYFVGKHLWELGFFKDKSLAQSAFSELKTIGYIRYEDLPLETKDGRSIKVEFVSNVYPVNHHKIIQCNIRDITARKNAESALDLAKRKLNLLSSITRHDILNKLNVLQGYYELSRERVPYSEIQEITKKEITTVQAIRRLISFAKDYEEMGVNAPAWQTVSSCIRKISASLPLNEVKVMTDGPEVDVFADLLLQKVFYNLIDNALTYGGDRLKTITVSSKQKDTGLVIVVEDNGAGISDEDKEHLFTRGFGKQTGLGLFLSREILSLTGITIIESGIPGQGARFEITVPWDGYRFITN